ncbi:MAG: rhomboid family intramembrane serine protease [Bacteroidetes bacterium]|nr:rhomboid family intramembrane serine protease [Bacteroidota bacterium]
MKNKQLHVDFGSQLEALVYPLLFLILLWLIQMFQQMESFSFVNYGVQPRTFSGLKGILFMPLIHAPKDIQHLLNNSLPAYMLLATVIYFYRSIALSVVLYSWLLSGLGVWLFAENTSSFHIGFSGVIYALAAFIFFSGFQRKFLPLQAMALFVSFVYGSLVWGIFPIKAGVSWEGHLSGLLVGAVLSVLYLKKGPVAPKYQYEIEKDMGIEPPDLEGIYWEKVRKLEEQQLQLEQSRKLEETNKNKIVIQYHYTPTNPPDDTGQQ